MKNLFFLILLIGFKSINAQSVPYPAKKQDSIIVIEGGTIHVGNGKILQDKFIVIQNGKIVQITDEKPVLNQTAIRKIDANGKHIYPGLIAASSHVGLSEIEAVRATRDNYEVGTFNSNVRSIIAYNTDSRVTPTLRTNGILMAQVIPSGGMVSGTSSVVQLDAWNWEDAAYKTDDGMWVSWPNIYSYNGWWAEPGGFTLNKNYDKEVEAIRTFFKEALAYCKDGNIEKKNLKFESMRSVFDKKTPVFIKVGEAKAIYQVLDFKREFNINIVIDGGNDAWLVAKELAIEKVPVVLDRVHALPSRADEDYDLPFRKAKILKDAGVLYCLSIDGFWQIRNLPFMAGTTAAYGLTKEEALSSVTLNTAKILGIEQQTGSIEVGKDATILISEGDILEMTGNKITTALIQGRNILLGNKQIDLYNKFTEKYEIK